MDDVCLKTSRHVTASNFVFFGRCQKIHNDQYLVSIPAPAVVSLRVRDAAFRQAAPRHTASKDMHRSGEDLSIFLRMQACTAD